MILPRRALLLSVFFSFASQASSAMWVFPEIDATSCERPLFLFNDKSSLDTEPVSITPVIVYDNDIHSDTFGFVCAGKERKYRVSDLREPCQYGWKARIERMPAGKSDSAVSLSSYELCVGMDFLLADIAVYVTADKVSFASVAPNGGEVFTDAWAP